MPNRIIKESICTSDTIDQLSWFEEVFFYRLLVNCDDYGRFDARTAILKARLFPLKSVTEKQISDALHKLSMVGIVALYEYDGRPYLQLVTWDKHQQIRSRKAKYPLPPEDIPCKREHIMPEEKDIDDLLYDVMSSTKRFEEHTLLSVERQVRVGESYLDIVAKTESSETLVFELKRGRLTNKAIDQISKYLTLINGNGILIGCGLSANFDIERCRSDDIAVVIYDDDLNMSLVLGNSAVNSIDLTLNHVKSRYAKLAPNPIQYNPIQYESESNSISLEAACATIDTDTLNPKEAFETFWKAYPRKVSKAKAKEWFDKKKPSKELLGKIMASLEEHKKTKQWQDPQYIPYPITWLSQKRCEDEVDCEPKTKTVKPVPDWYSDYERQVANFKPSEEHLSDEEVEKIFEDAKKLF